MKSSTRSRPFPLSGNSIPESIAYSRESDSTKDCERDSPAFRGLLHAASHSSCKQDILDSPYATRSISETDDDGHEHDLDDDDVAVNDSLGVDDSDNVRRSSDEYHTPCGGTRCHVDGCMKYVVSEGLCLGHGGGRQCRGSPRCSSNAVSRGLCAQHGGGRKCSEENCNKHVASGGLCRTHGGGRRCQVPDCTSSAQSRGLCYVHGGGGRCQREGCRSSAKKGGLCIAHGGGHRCQVAGCASSAVSGARCRAHGGGRRCAVEGCVSSAKTGGRCIMHGGGKRCTVSGCTSSAQRLGLCKAHGGGRRCVVENCANSAVSRGCCIAHGGGKRCVFEGCTTTARKGGFCFAHGGRSTSSTATNKRKMSTHTSPLATTPASTTAEPLLWPSEVRSPIPALNLPPRRLLPPINAMLLANRPGILRRYQYTQIPPLRSPVVSLRRGRSQVHNMFDEEWGESLSHMPTGQPTKHSPVLTPASSSKRAGYSWQRLQETIRRESKVHGISNDEDESLAYEDKSTLKVSNREMELDEGPMNGGVRSHWTRRRGSIA
ncbi:hypothetical protein PsorP6_008787 [Peronosclerospora sorghi]|uniref:Uncharacterized protein n=1 Tax=Peronosclerospora sorghi TaxID=230839 RepID=A0ACC0VXX4_9STRA|nr:hypothetical protein PsorP6_008787 [Peronosclerospora sorghi]